MRPAPYSLVAALVTLAACHGGDREAYAHAESAVASSGVYAVAPALPAGVLVVDLVSASPELAIDKPAEISVGADHAAWSPAAAARFEHLSADAKHVIGLSGPYLVEPAVFTFPSASQGARIALRVLPYGPLPPPTPVFGERAPTPPESVLELDLTRPDTIGVVWSQGASRYQRERDGFGSDPNGPNGPLGPVRPRHGVTIALSEISRSAPDLAERFKAEWDARATHSRPDDAAADPAFLRVEKTASVSAVATVVAALLTVRRERAAQPGVQAPAFAITITPPVVEPKLVLDDEVGPLDVVGAAADRGAAIAGAVDPMRDALAKCGVASCSPALRARLFLHLGEALSAAGKRDDAELAFFRAHAIDLTLALDPRAAASSKTAFAAARARHLPKPKVLPMRVSGRLADALIEAAIAARAGLVRLCVAEGQRKNPELEGHFAVRFVIGADGMIGMTGNGGSNLPDGETVSCLVQTFDGLLFRRPDAGVVVVTYTIGIEPSRGK